MHRLRPRSVALITITTLVSVGATTARAQQADALAPLQGRWLVTGGEHNGEPMDSLNGGVMTVDGAAFEIRTVSGNLLRGTLRLDASERPPHMDLLHADGTRWEAIYEVDREALRLNYVDAEGTDPRPTSFVTSAATEESLIILRREDR